MKTILLAGGLGTRLSEETRVRPKPMVEIGGKPMLWHIMSIYAKYGFSDFVVACGYKGEVIKEYFHNFYLHNADWSLNLKDGSKVPVNSNSPSWNVELIDTGRDTLTAGRILRLRPYLGDGRFMVTYGDGVADVDLGALVEFHEKHGRLATVTAVRPPARFGGLALEGDQVSVFSEKPQSEEGWINGGFFVFEPGVFDYLKDGVALERDPLEQLARAGELMAFRHAGFWQAMDTLREVQLLESLWTSGKAPWKVW